MNKFEFKTRQLADFLFEVIITNKEGTRFGCIYQAPQPVPDRYISQSFMEEPKEFFMEVEAVLVSQLLLT